MLEKLNEAQLDAIKEVGNIGTGNAATALSMMLDKKVEISVPQVKVIPISKIPFLFENPEEVVCSVKMELKEDMTGEILLVFDPKTVKALARVLTGMEIADITEMDEFTSSMMKEIGNIMCGSYITALAGFTNLFINPEPPELIVDMISAIISEISIPLALAGEENILLVETLIEIEGLEEALQGYLLLVPSVDSLEKLLKALGM
ncbi:CheY-P phosphatase CheC [Fervidobacterium pennivorans subsp. shakshaketiis]|jgi:chemotaxis protein CheC|uniref:Chemotaxis protein CheC, inhibitor of MCP methylation n=1 Tax=Fervidobacterium pennivorans (strain DSM 9078 / Ven5) TaxID=771875 RepID=H9U9Y8_FERPD|nr:CheY-P phosphatase CheC [Fervidobacterium pennivorans]AFG34331.1 chemotaxis protein CheC, inhibitor of MCP methylation [Fervidobacterium pennivorans DSM 9078]